MNVEVYTGKVDNSDLLTEQGVTGSLVAQLSKPFEQ